eukprot:765321-Hanusia_phi.AAC.2
MDAFETACNASLLSRCNQNGLAYYWHDQVGNLQILLFDANPLDRLDLIALDSTLLTSLKITTQVLLVSGKTCLSEH